MGGEPKVSALVPSLTEPTYSEEDKQVHNTSHGVYYILLCTKGYRDPK